MNSNFFLVVLNEIRIPELEIMKAKEKEENKRCVNITTYKLYGCVQKLYLELYESNS